MTEIFARVLTEAERNLRRVRRIDSEIYETIEFGEPVLYDQENEIGEGLWFYFPDFKGSDYAESSLLDLSWTTEYDEIERDEKVDLLIAKKGEQVFFQLNSSKSMQKKKLLWLDEQYNLYENYSVITINDIPDAVYDKNTDCLFFRDEKRIARIFGGFWNIIHEATDNEIGEFVRVSNIHFENGFEISKIGVRNRSRLTRIKDLAGKLNDEETKQYISTYRPNLLRNGEYYVENNTALTQLIDGIEQKYYMSGIDNERMIANSRRRFV